MNHLPKRTDQVGAQRVRNKFPYLSWHNKTGSNKCIGNKDCSTQVQAARGAYLFHKTILSESSKISCQGVREERQPLPFHRLLCGDQERVLQEVPSWTMAALKRSQKAKRSRAQGAQDVMVGSRISRVASNFCFILQNCKGNQVKHLATGS